MADLIVTSQGQVTLNKEVLQHLGVAPGQKVDLAMLPHGEVRIKAKPSKPISSLFGNLKAKNVHNVHATIEEINDVIADGWAGLGRVNNPNPDRGPLAG